MQGVSPHIAAGDAHTCVITASGGVKCWGGNSKGQLGDGTTNDSLTPVDVIGLGSAALVIGAGAEHTCAVLVAGVKCWGDNDHGQLGTGIPGDSAIPLTVFFAAGVKAIDGGLDHTCALIEGGLVICWGANDKGQLGSGPGADTMLPGNAINLGSPATAIAAGAKFNCAIIFNSGVRCWGENTNRQLGDGTNSNAPTPVSVIGVGRAVALAAGDSHACATEYTADPDNNDEQLVHCWGKNNHGQLGAGTNTPAEDVVHVLTKAYLVNLAAGESHTCGLAASGARLCWGQNLDGRLGAGYTSTEENAPVGIINLPYDPIEIAAGLKHTCALHSDGFVYCWGLNGDGQLGCGTTDDAWSPEPVSGLP